MTESSKEDDDNKKMSAVSKKGDITKDQEKDDSGNDSNSIWSKESVIMKIKVLSDELDKERKEWEIERKERQKEREENKVSIKGMQ